MPNTTTRTSLMCYAGGRCEREWNTYGNAEAGARLNSPAIVSNADVGCACGLPDRQAS
jgi:hypothetical protein